MSSSISSSDPAPTAGPARTAWRGWIATFCAVLVGGQALFYVFVLTADPFSTGRFSLFDGVDIAISSRAWSNAGRVRDLDFDAAIIGNSRGARFAPAQLDALTGHRFVQLAVYATGPNEQLAMAGAFLRAHGARPTALLFTLDQTWCDAAETTVYPHFPFWLYQSGNAEYARNIFSPDAVEGAFRRLAIHAFGARPAGPRDGYDPQEPAWPPEVVARDMARARPDAAAPATRFPFAGRLAQLIAATPAGTQAALVVLPHYISYVPAPGTPAAAALDACKAAYRAIAGSRDGVTFIDFLRDDAAARDGANFADTTHAHDRYVRQLAERLAPALRRAAD